ncbi:hypothetical protein ScPMuIL_014643 [Solemya velum]
MSRVAAVLTHFSTRLTKVQQVNHTPFNYCRLVFYRKMSATLAPYGTWKSPISSKLVSESSVSFQEVHVDIKPSNKDTVYWSELRFDEGGRYVVCSHKKGDNSYVSWTPKDFNARTRVHEYGGGSFIVNDGTVYFSNYKDQCLYSQEASDAAPKRLTVDATSWRYADGQFFAKMGKIYCVREDHVGVETGQTKEAVNTIVAVDVASGDQNVLSSGADFYSSPRVSPDGKKIAWVQWYHPNMPWDITELWVADLEDSGAAIKEGTAKMIAGGGDELISVMHPSWTPDNELLYISDKTEWWNLYHLTSTGEHVNVLPKDHEIGSPHWVFGNLPYVVDPSGSGNIAITFQKLMNLKTKEYSPIDTGFQSHSNLSFTCSGDIYCIAGSSTKFSCIIHVDTKAKQTTVLRESKSLSLDAGYFSFAKDISWKTTEGDVAHGYLYLPKNKDFSGTEGTLPPLLVKVHGGPTAQASNVLNLKIQYFTSRGFAVLDVNYRGSTGYGRSYRHKLRQMWGVYDIEDCCSGAQYLAESGQVDGNRLCIDGGSAGGYTTLACLVFKNVFKAGASHYGVADLSALAEDTHKFESRYLDSIIAPYEGEGKKVYTERSPITYVEKLNCPTAFFQGDEDKIVLPNQAEMMYNAVKAKGLPTMYILFEGEQHGFRKAENIQTALDGEFYFFGKVFGFEPADKHCELPISNL